jgi:hypothetical protein
MAINRSDRYPGRWDTPTPGQPEGACKNKTGPSAVDGSYLEKDWMNDFCAFFSSLLGGVAASGTPDSVGASQYFDGLIDIIYPVGRVVYSDDNVNPGTLYAGTTWAALGAGRFIASVGSHTDGNGDNFSVPAGDIIEGTYNHTLTEAEMPSHSHDIPRSSSSNTSGGDYHNSTNAEPNVANPTATTGSDNPHNNIPPGYGLYIWKRTA